MIAKTITALLAGLFFFGVALTPRAAHAQTDPKPTESSGTLDPNAPAVERSDTELLLKILEELASLQDRLDRLEASFDRFDEEVAEELLTENQRLRRAIRRQYGESPENLPAVPLPERGLIEETLDEEGGKAPVQREFSHTVVREWGRTPEEAADLNAEADSLKGMVVAVPEWSEDEDLIRLARDLRKQYKEFANINIEIFNDLESAQQFAQQGVSNPEHRVISISKYEGSGRDVILLIRGSEIREVPLEPEETSQP